MSILQYYERVPGGVHVDFSQRGIPLPAIAAANKEVRLALASKTSKKGPYNKYTHKQRAEIGEKCFGKRCTSS